MSSPLAVPLVLLALCLASYSLLTPWLGFYWDDLPFLWIAEELGAEKLASYFSTNRPLLGWMVRASTAILGDQAWQWQVFGVFCRWFSALAFWVFLKRLWPRDSRPALWAAVLFVVYPGTPVQYISVVFSPFFIVLGAFFLSLLCSLAALENPRHAVLLTFMGLALSLVNLLVLDYFFMLELLRPLLLWWAAGRQDGERRPRIKMTLAAAWPYLALFAGAMVWRAFFFSNQTTNYQPALLEQMRQQPLAALAGLAGTVLSSLWVSLPGAWAQVFDFPLLLASGQRTVLVYALLSVGVALLLAFYLLCRRQAVQASDHAKKEWAVQASLAGLGWLLLAGPPYWLVDLSVNLGFPNSRVLISFLPGASLLLAGLLGMLPRRTPLLVLSVLTGLAAGYQFFTGNIFRRDWDIQNQLFWQMSWRMPDIEPGTTLLVNDLPVHYSTDNSLTAALNWMYAPGSIQGDMPYLLYYPTLRLGGGLPALEPGIALQEDYLALSFSGSTSQVLALSFNPPACLRVLDPEIDAVNLTQAEIMRKAAGLSDETLIVSAGEDSGAVPPAGVFDEEPAHGWCYYFEKAELARQQGDWQEVITLGEEAFALGDYPNDPSERLVFIEGYAHVGDWEKAQEMSDQTAAITGLMEPVLCRVWERIAREVPASAEGDAVIAHMLEDYSCD